MVGRHRIFMNPFFSKGRTGPLSTFAAILGLGLSACASSPPLHSMAPGPTPDQGFPGVSVSGRSSQWPTEGPPKEELNHRIYSKGISPEAIAAPVPPPEKKKPVVAPHFPVQKTVYFSFNSARLSYWDKVVLDRLAKCLKVQRYKSIMLYGSTDPLGSEIYNKKLGLWRSLSVKRYLVSKGLPRYRLKAVSWGDKKARLFSSCRKRSQLCHSQSRSVRIEIRKRD